MRWRMWTIAATAWLALGASAPAGDKIDLKVLYAGNPGSEREKDFTAFLKEQFTEVGTTDYEKFLEDEAKGYDVVLFDWTSTYPRDKDGKLKPNDNTFIRHESPKLPEGFSRPTVLIAEAGGAIVNKLTLKINWL